MWRKGECGRGESVGGESVGSKKKNPHIRNVQSWTGVPEHIIIAGGGIRQPSSSQEFESLNVFMNESSRVAYHCQSER